MMRSMMSAVTGLRAQQTAMDVIGNNIANVNTDGFKESTTNFEDLFYQTLNAGTPEINPSQVGYGAQVSGVSKNMTSTGANQTDNPTDLYIDGEGYFAVNTQADGKGETYYTRVGNFHFDSKGYLMDNNNDYVLSNQPDGNGNYLPVHLDTDGSGDMYLYPNDGTTAPIQITADGTPKNGFTGAAVSFADLTDVSFNDDGSIKVTAGGYTGTLSPKGDDPAGTPTNPEKVGIATFLNDQGLLEDGNNDYSASQSSGAPNYTTAGANGSSTKIRTNALEMSNVDLAEEFTNMIVTERGFQANSRVITTSDTMLQELLNLIH